MRVWLCLFSILLAFSGPVLAEIRYGNWQMEIRIQVNGIYADQRVYRHTQCLTPEAPIPRGYLQQLSCRIEEQTIRRNTVTWQASCFSPEGTLQQIGKLRFQRNTFEGKVNLRQVDASVSSTVTHDLRGRRLGDCASQ